MGCRRNRFFIVGLLSAWLTMLVGGCGGVDSVSHQAAPVPAGKSGYVDVHVHLWKEGKIGLMSKDRPTGRRSDRDTGAGFPLQQPSFGGYVSSGGALIDKMDAMHVAYALLLPPPRTESNRDDDEEAALMQLADKYPNRFGVVAGGNELNQMIHTYKPAEVTPLIKESFAGKAEQLARSGIKGFGEMAALHLSFNEHHVYEEMAPDHPLFLVLADIAAQYDLPIDLHMEAVQYAMNLPKGFQRASDRNPPYLKANIDGMERFLAHNRKARIVWQHIGWDNTGQMSPKLLRRLLVEHDNLYLALRVEERRQTIGGEPMPNRLVDGQWRILPEWMELVSQFPDRFMIGTDEFVGAAGEQKKAPRSFDETWRILEQFPADLAQKVGRENARRVYRLQF